MGKRKKKICSAEDVEKTAPEMDALDRKVCCLNVNVEVYSGYGNETILQVIANTEIEPGTTTSIFNSLCNILENKPPAKTKSLTRNTPQSHHDWPTLQCNNTFSLLQVRKKKHNTFFT